MINCVEFTNDILHFLRNKVINYSLKLLDVIRLASALWLRDAIDEEIKFICSDKDFIKFVENEKFDIINPKKS